MIHFLGMTILVSSGLGSPAQQHGGDGGCTAPVSGEIGDV